MSTRSHWAWGYEDRFPDERRRKDLVDQLTMFMDIPGLKVRPLPSIDQARMPAPRIQPPAHLADICSQSPYERALHTYGRGFPDLLRGYHGDFTPAPDIVARPQDEAQVVAVLEWARAENVAVVPFGGGSSVVGGVECGGKGFAGVVSLNMGAMNKVLEIDEASLSARIQAGAFGPQIEAQLGAKGLTLRHFPQSFEFSTLGGWIATRAGGHFATLYTHIDDLVQSSRMVTAKGVWESRRLPGSGAGPSPDRMVLGSEGAFGVITEAWMRVRPKPGYRSKASVAFVDFSSAVEATRRISQSGLYPSNCRLLDRREAMLNQVSWQGENVLLLGFESADHTQVSKLERALEICAESGGRLKGEVSHREPTALAVGQAPSKGEDAGETWKQAFIEAPYLFSSLVSLGAVVDTFETAVTWDKFDALHAAVIREVGAALKAACGRGVLTCRFTHVYPDGPAPYYTFIGAGKPGQEFEQWKAIKAIASQTLLDFGATITHHHAVGRVHRRWYEQQRPAPMGGVLRAIKGELDPEGVMNPGVLV